MKEFVIFAVLAVCAGALFAQAPQVKTAPAPAGKAAAQPKQAPAAVQPAAKAAEEAEESFVMIDSRGDAEEIRPAASAADAEGSGAAGGLPSSYGQCRGVLNEGGRSVLVFESLEDGTLSFVQITLGKTGVSWKLVDQLRRSAD